MVFLVDTIRYVVTNVSLDSAASIFGDYRVSSGGTLLSNHHHHKNLNLRFLQWEMLPQAYVQNVMHHRLFWLKSSTFITCLLWWGCLRGDWQLSCGRFFFHSQFFVHFEVSCLNELLFVCHSWQHFHYPYTLVCFLRHRFETLVNFICPSSPSPHLLIPPHCCLLQPFFSIFKSTANKFHGTCR